MSEIFPKIGLKFYYNITTYNQTNEYIYIYILKIYQTNE